MFAKAKMERCRVGDTPIVSTEQASVEQIGTDCFLFGCDWGMF